MLKKILFNIFLNIAIIVVGICIVWAVKNKLYLYAVAGLPPMAMLIFLKIRLVKMVREITKK